MIEYQNKKQYHNFKIIILLIFVCQTPFQNIRSNWITATVLMYHYPIKYLDLRLNIDFSPKVTFYVYGDHNLKNILIHDSKPIGNYPA
jgi:hypothetical protein